MSLVMDRGSISMQHVIVFSPAIDRILVSAKQRELIDYLTERDDFRVDGVYHVVKVLLFSFATLLFISVVLVLIFGMSALLMCAAFLVFWIFIFFHYRSDGYMFSALGLIAKGRVDDVWFEYLRTPGWKLTYSFRDSDGVEWKSSKFCIFRFKKLNKKSGDELCVFYNPVNQKQNELFKSSYLYLPCISRSKYAMLLQMELR